MRARQFVPVAMSRREDKRVVLVYQTCIVLPSSFTGVLFLHIWNCSQGATAVAGARHLTSRLTDM